MLKAHRLEIDLDGTAVKRDGAPVDFAAKEFELLRYLVRHSGTTISRSRLLSEIRGYTSDTETRTVEVQIGLLRHKLEENPKDPVHLVTVRGLGYKFLP